LYYALNYVAAQAEAVGGEAVKALAGLVRGDLEGSAGHPG
jgi:hypothetical protein